MTDNCIEKDIHNYKEAERNFLQPYILQKPHRRFDYDLVVIIEGKDFSYLTFACGI